MDATFIAQLIAIAIVCALAWVLAKAGRNVLSGSEAARVRREGEQRQKVQARATEFGSAIAIERRMPRSGWGKFWKWSLIVWTLIAAYDAFSIFLRLAEMTEKTSDGLAMAVLSNVAANRLLQTAVIWGFGAAILGLATFATRGAKYIETVQPDNVGNRNGETAWRG